MHIITKLTMATVGAAWLTISTSLSPVKAALLGFNFTVPDFESANDGSVRSVTGSFSLNTQTREIFNIGGELLSAQGTFLGSESFIYGIDNNLILTVFTASCADIVLDEDGNIITCPASQGRARRLELVFRGEGLFNQLSIDPSVYENSFIQGTRRGDIENPFVEVIGSALEDTLFNSSIRSPVTALQVERLDAVEAVPEPSTTTAILTIGALGSGLLLKRKRETLV